jgi:DNA-directed RNA polymerase specialized sigma24 family protein
MRDELPLDSYLDQYYQGEMEKRELEGLIFEFILQNYQTYHLYQHWEKEDCIDYLCWLYPRVSNAIDRYRFEGASFTAYLATTVRRSIREFRFQDTEHRLSEQTYWDASSREMAVHSPEPEYLGSRRVRAFRPVNNRQQALLLLLKSYCIVSEEYIARAAPAIGIKKETLTRMIEELRKLRVGQDAQIRVLKEQIHAQYFRCITFEKRRNASSAGSGRRLIMQDRLNRAEKRLASMRKRLQRIKAGASNRQVARVLGIPKGTVDSNLHAAKAKGEREKEEYQYDDEDDALSWDNGGAIIV